MILNWCTSMCVFGRLWYDKKEWKREKIETKKLLFMNSGFAWYKQKLQIEELSSSTK